MKIFRKGTALLLALLLAAGTGETAVLAAKEETAESGLPAHEMEYIYVDEAVVSAPGSENIAVGFADDRLVIDHAVLHGTSSLTGETQEWEAAAFAEGSVLFTMDYSGEQTEDVMDLTGMTYEVQGTEYYVDFRQEEIQASYKIEGSAYETENETPEISVYSLDENGEEIEISGESAEEVLGRSTGSTKGGKKIVFLCAGHDRTHTGAAANGLREEELNFKVAQYCKAYLENLPGVEVYVDRSTPECKYPGKGTIYCLEQRVKDAAALGAEVFVDIHFNSSGAGAYGAEVYYPNKSYSEEIHQDGKELANEILENLEALGLYDRGAKVKDCTTGDTDQNGNLDDYYTSIQMAKERGMTGLIVEHAFIDSEKDAAKLKNESFLKQLGEADAKALADHYNLWEEPDYGSLGFWDVREEDWYFDTVAYVKDKGIMTGMREGYFGAVETIDRSQFVTTLYRMEGEPAVNSGVVFPDVPENLFFTNAVKWANEAGIVTGYTAGPAQGTFGPQDQITREQIATMFYRYARYKGYDTRIQNTDAWKTYPDAGRVSSFAEDAIAWAVGNGMIQGDQGKLNPQTKVSRAVAATLIERFCTQYQESGE